MTCSRMEHDGMRYLDGEMSEQERSEFEHHIESCDVCRRSMRELGAVNRLTRSVAMRDPQDEFWERYWKSLYRRLERRTAWIFVITGTAVLIGYEAYRALRSFGEITVEKVALLMVLAGVVLLLVSVVRERLHQYGGDPYRDVKR
jgi:anti-sigma factor RsiW